VAWLGVARFLDQDHNPERCGIGMSGNLICFNDFLSTIWLKDNNGDWEGIKYLCRCGLLSGTSKSEVKPTLKYTSQSRTFYQSQSKYRYQYFNPLALNPVGPHLFNPAGSTHVYFQISHTYISSLTIAKLARLGECNEKWSKTAALFLFWT
jgi:hypothetical protein